MLEIRVGASPQGLLVLLVKGNWNSYLYSHSNPWLDYEEGKHGSGAVVDAAGVADMIQFDCLMKTLLLVIEISDS